MPAELEGVLDDRLFEAVLVAKAPAEKKEKRKKPRMRLHNRHEGTF